MKWIIIIVAFLGLSLVAAYFYTKTFVIMDGIDTPQINSYQQAQQKAVEIKDKMEAPSQNLDTINNKLDNLQKQSQISGY